MTFSQIVADQYGVMTGRTDFADLPHAERNSPEVSIPSRPVFRRRDRIPGTGDQMQATRSVRAFLSHAAGLADVARKNQLDAGQRDAVLRGQAVDDALENVVCRARFANSQCQ